MLEYNTYSLLLALKLLITGSNGLLGQKLVHLLSSQSIGLIATSRGDNRIPNQKGYTFASMEATDLENVWAVFEKYKPDAVIHAAAMTNVDECEIEQENCWKQNVQATQNIVKACQKFNSFLCHVSTDFIFDGKAGPYDENAIPNPISFYGESKRAAEEIVQNSPISWAIARTVLVYGITHEMSRSNIILWVKNSLENQKHIKVVHDQFRTPTLAEDLAMGCWLIVQKKIKGIFNISGKDFLTPYEMALETADFFGLDKNFIEKADSSTFQQTAKRPPRTGFILTKAQTELGYAPHSFKDGIAIVAKQLETYNNGRK